MQLLQFHLGLELNTDKISQIIKCKIYPGAESLTEHLCTSGIINLYLQKVHTINQEIHSLETTKARLLARIHHLEQ